MSEVVDSVIGFDVGTGNLVAAKKREDKKMELSFMRNMYLPLEPSMIEANEISETKLNYIEQKNDDGGVENYCVIGEDSYKMGNVFNLKVSRPMSKGVISSKNIDSIDIISEMIEHLIGKAPTPNSYVVYSIPAAPVDNPEASPINFHKRVFEKIFKDLGYKSESLNEACAVNFSQASSTNFSSISISFGSGMTNVALNWKGLNIFQFSIEMGGDFIDESVSKSLNLVQNKVTNIKEKKCSLNGDSTNIKNKIERRVFEAVEYFYRELIETVIDHINDEFDNHSDSLDIDDDQELPIILSGGTSMIPGFTEFFETTFNENKNFPYSISEIRPAKDALGACAAGCLIYALNKVNKQK